MRYFIPFLMAGNDVDAAFFSVGRFTMRLPQIFLRAAACDFLCVFLG
jgi:hypothetical protein